MRPWIVLLGSLIAAVTLVASLIVANSANADSVPTPTGMLPPGTYPLTLINPLSDDATSSPSVSVTNSGLYLQNFNLPPDNIQLALSADPQVSNAVDLDSVYLDGVTFEPACGSSCIGYYDILYRPANLTTLTAPYSWNTDYYQSDPSDPSNPQSGIFGISYTAYPPTILQNANGSTTEVQEIDSTMLFLQGYSIGGSLTQQHFQVVDDPTRTLDIFQGTITTSQGSDRLSEAVRQGTIGTLFGNA